jgi:hypothetical protein
MPEYTYDGLNEKQFKALKVKMMEYPNEYDNHGIVVSNYGGKRTYRGDYSFVMRLDADVLHKDEFVIDRNDIEVDDTLTKTVDNILEYMDGIAKELEKIIEENEES